MQPIASCIRFTPAHMVPQRLQVRKSQQQRKHVRARTPGKQCSHAHEPTTHCTLLSTHGPANVRWKQTSHDKLGPSPAQHKHPRDPGPTAQRKRKHATAVTTTVKSLGSRQMCRRRNPHQNHAPHARSWYLEQSGKQDMVMMTDAPSKGGCNARTCAAALAVHPRRINQLAASVDRIPFNHSMSTWQMCAHALHTRCMQTTIKRRTHPPRVAWDEFRADCMVCLPHARTYSQPTNRKRFATHLVMH